MSPQKSSSTIQTERLILRPWREEDLDIFSKINADPRVMEFFPSTLNSEESNELAKRISIKLEKQGWERWAVTVPNIANFIGFIGLAEPSFSAHFTPCIEIGWRLGFEYWGKGYATEGATAALAYGFETLGLKEIISFTALQNIRSRRVMERIGMHHDPKDDFDHPRLAEGHPLRRHVLYRLNHSSWSKK